MTFFRKIKVFFNALFSWNAQISSILLFLLVFLITLDVIGRYVFDSPIPGTFEITEVMMVFIVFLAFAYTEMNDENIRIQLIEKYISDRQKAVLDLLAYLLGLLIYGVICWQAWSQAWGAVEIDQRMSGLLRLPLWPGKFIVIIGSFLLTMQFIIGIITRINTIFQKRPD